MNSEVMSFKAKIKSFAMEEGIPPQIVLQNFMFERFFARLAKSNVRDNLIIKGGAIISQYLGLSRRTTMDIDITLRNKPLSKESVMEILTQVFSADVNDQIDFNQNSVDPIRKDDEYGGFRVKMTAVWRTIRVDFSIDISTGDAITPEPEEFFFKSQFEQNDTYRLMAYPLETIIAEKMEAILSLGIFSTRPRDYYDVYMLSTAIAYNQDLLKKAFSATVNHRGSASSVSNWHNVFANIRESKAMRGRWEDYRKHYAFAAHIDFDSIIVNIANLFETVLN